MTCKVRVELAALVVVIPILTMASRFSVIQARRIHSDLGSHPQIARRPGGRLELTSLQIRSPVLVQVLNHAELQELRPESAKLSQDLRLRLFAVPEEGDCVKDSHYVCSHRYYLAASAFEEGLGEAVYDLGEVGEIAEIRWLKSQQPLTAHLNITVTNFPAERFRDNDSLTKKQKRYGLVVGLDRLSVSSLEE